MIHFDNDSSELINRRNLMTRDGYRECDIPACNCGSWHKRPGRGEEKLIDLVQRLIIDIDVVELAADVNVLNKWRKDAKETLEKYYT